MTQLITALKERIHIPRRRSELPPGPPLPAVAQMFEWTYRPIQFMESCEKRYGDVFTMRFPGYDPEVLFTHPRAIKEIFTGSPNDLHAGEANSLLEPLVGAKSVLLLDGKRHLHRRRLVLPPFHGERMHAYAETMRQVTDQIVDRFPIDEPFAVHERMQALTLDIILRTVFGLATGDRLDVLRDKIESLLSLSANPIWLLPWVQIDLGRLTPWASLVEVSNQIDELIYLEIAERRGAAEVGADILSMLVAARDEEGRPMTDQELRDEMLTLLVAGHETTATALAWSFERILRRPDVRSRIEHELAEVLDGAPVSDHHLPKLRYLDATIKETLRLNPVIPIIGRRTQRPMTIGGHRLPAGVLAAPCIYLAHRRPDVWDNPLRFDPERFLDKKPDPYEFFPFGGGVRRCIGMAFAMFEMKLVLAQILSRTHLELKPGYEAQTIRRSITFSPSEGVPLIARRRS